MLYGKHFVSNLTLRTEINIWILTAGWLHVIKLDLLQSTLSGGCLLGLGSIGTESLDKFLQLLDLFFLLLVGFLHLLDHQLA